ncbi:MKRN2 opposite strand protein [Corythoichthys intestinalis]|uniref:MKRN2 opposite strand protein n=1 Tax=Corythoichthys intestinalis TaxID=161448 RepID=UPI0025A5B0A7|nr:MKRN2 opposite strand protein [Corythoichthys intestinalis]XP_061814002.1 MKRN2 opposite strand protein-like [Nerophis lumbriciformis]
MEEPGVLRVRHECLNDIFCFSLPLLCPACGEALAGRRLHQAPVSLPDPLGDGHKTPCCLLVAPVDRHAGGDFDGTSELHTGISNTSGMVYNYTERGVVQDRHGWDRCLSVPLVRPDMFHLLAQWDRYLEQFSRGPMWDPTCRSFCEDSHNCLTFCVAFINGVLAAEGHGRASLSRDDLTRDVIAPAVSRACKYAALRRHLQQHQFYVMDMPAGPSGPQPDHLP